MKYLIIILLLVSCSKESKQYTAILTPYKEAACTINGRYQYLPTPYNWKVNKGDSVIILMWGLAQNQNVDVKFEIKKGKKIVFTKILSSFARPMNQHTKVEFRYKVN